MNTQLLKLFVACTILLFSGLSAAKETLQCPPLDSNGQRRIDATAIQMLEKCNLQAPTTKSLYFKTDQQRYSPERQDLHESIEKGFLKGRPCVAGKPPIAILTGGIAASGKTTFLKKHYPWVLSDHVVSVNSDDIREQFPEYQGWNANSTYQEGSDVSKQLLAQAIRANCKHHLAYDSNMSNAEYYGQLIPKLKNLGYRVFIVYLKIPPKVAAHRVLKRYQTSGRYVPVGELERMNKDSIRVFDTIKSEVDGYIVVNGENGEIVERHGEAIPEGM